MPHLIRIAKTKADEWINGIGTAPALAQNIFGLKKVHRGNLHDVCEESTYFVNGAEEEVRVAAAHLLTKTAPKVETRYVVRMLIEDVTRAGLQICDHAFGQTGIGWIDFRHRDLVGTKGQFEQLVANILHRLAEGEDRVRRIGRPQYEHALKHFAGLSAMECPTHTRNLSQCVLDKNPIDGIVADITLAKDELSKLRIPEDATSLRAYCLHECGNGAGAMSTDWFNAQSELRQNYGLHYLKSVCGQDPVLVK